MRIGPRATTMRFARTHVCMYARTHTLTHARTRARSYTHSLHCALRLFLFLFFNSFFRDSRIPGVLRMPNLKSVFIFALAFLQIVVTFAIFRVIFMVPFLRNIAAKRSPHFKKRSEDFNPYGWEMLKYLMTKRWNDVTKKAHLGGHAPNSTLLSVDGLQEHKLLEMMKACRPLVLNFGSCT